MMTFEVGDAVKFKSGRHKNREGLVSAVRSSSDENKKGTVEIIEYTVSVTEENGLQRQLKAAPGDLKRL